MDRPGAAVSGPQGLGDTGDPWVCPACRTRIKASEGGTAVTRTEVSGYRLYPDGTACRDPDYAVRVQYYHGPCWAAAVGRFNAQQAEGFRTGDHA